MPVRYKKEIISALFTLITLALFPFNLKFIVTQPLFYLLLSACVGFFIWKMKSQPYQELLSKYRSLIIIFLCSVMVLAVYGPLLQARWGAIDDHEIMRYLGNDGEMTLKEWPGWFARSEATKPGELLRYRPTYQAVRLFETLVWDNHPQLWYATRLIFFITFLVILWHLVLPMTGLFWGGLLTFYVFSFDYWRDIWARLGPSEAYAVLGLSLYAWAFQHIIGNNKPAVARWLLLLVGGILAIGSKENMVLLIIPTLVLWWHTTRSSGRVVLPQVVLLSLVAFALFVGGAVVTAVTNAGHDVYSAAATPTSRLLVLITAFKTQQAKILLLTLGLAGCFLVYQLVKIQHRPLLEKTLLFMMVVGSLLFVFVTQFVFYNGVWPDHNRYDFPGMLYEPIFYLSLFWYIAQLCTLTSLDKSVRNGLHWGSVLGSICVITMRGLVSTQVTIAEAVQRTNNHTQRIETIATTARTQPNQPIILESSNVWDYEPIFSYEVFLRAHGVSNPIAVRVHGYSPSSVQPGLEVKLAAELVTLSESGNHNFSSLSGVSNGDNCWSVVLSGNPTTTCKRIE